MSRSSTRLFVATSILGLVCTWAHSPCSAENSETDVKVVGLSIVLPDPDSEYGQSAVFGRPGGVEVHVQISDPDAFFISVVDDDEPAVSISAAGGKELKPDSGGQIDFMSEISEDGTTVTIPFVATEIPPADTDQLTIKGSVSLIAGSDPKTDSVTFKVADDVEVKLGTVQTKLTEVEQDPFGDGGWMFSFQSSESMDTVQEIKFFDGDGKELESSSMGSSSFGFNDDMTYGQSFMVEGEAKEITAKVSYFGSTRKVNVPIDLSVGLSLGK